MRYADEPVSRSPTGSRCADDPASRWLALTGQWITGDESAREKTKTLVDYASSQAKLGEPMGLEELSGLIDEERPKAFYDHIRNKDYGMAPEFPADKRTLNQFRRFTGRAEGLSISFEAHLLGSRIEYDEERDTLRINSVPTQLRDQLKRRKAQIGE